MLSGYLGNKYPNKFIVIVIGNYDALCNEKETFFNFSIKYSGKNPPFCDYILFVFDDRSDAQNFLDKECDEGKVAFYAQLWGPLSSVSFARELSTYKDAPDDTMICLTENT